jgi:Snf7
MNCLLEAVAGAYLTVRARLMADPVEEEVYSAQDSLENCRRTMEVREREYVEESRQLGAAALAMKRAGNFSAARARVLDRRRVVKRIEKLRHGLVLVDSQLEAIRTTELDREIMLTLRASTLAMKKAGIGVKVQDAEQVMTELDETLNQTHDLTTVLSTPLAYAEEDQELDAELEWLEETPLLDPGMAFAVERPPNLAPAAPEASGDAPRALGPVREEPGEELEAAV